MHPNIEIRRLRIAVYTYGVGVLLFALWSAAETTMLLLWSEEVSEIIHQSSSVVLARIAAIVTSVILVGFGIAIRCYITSRAVRVAKGRKCSNRFLYVASVLAACSLALTVIPFVRTLLSAVTGAGFSQIAPEEISLNRVVEMVIQISSDIILLRLVATVIRLKKAEAHDAA